jgi:hypothetical protein
MNSHEAKILHDTCEPLVELASEGYEPFRGGNRDLEKAAKAYLRVLYVIDLLDKIQREVELPRGCKKALRGFHGKLDSCMEDARQHYGW